MDILLSAKGDDVTVWRAVENFTAAYRQALLEMATSDGGDAEAVFSETCAGLEAVITTHQNLLSRLNSLIEEVASADMTTDISELTISFFSDLYRHFEYFRSAPVFYQLSMAFLKQVCTTVTAQAIAQLGLSARELPEMELIALGLAGRCEYSPFHPLQILLVHGEATESQLQNIHFISQALHVGLEVAGVPVDPLVTPSTPLWRGTVAEWRQRCEDWLNSKTAESFVNLSRLVDLFPLCAEARFAQELKGISRSILNSSRPALADLVVRTTSLSNGLGFMGRLKLERSGSSRGLFRIMDYGLLPLSSALSVLAHIEGSLAVTTCERVNYLLRKQELDVELAERMLSAWYFLHDLRLHSEQSLRIGTPLNQPLLLNPDDLTAEQQQELKMHLEAVAAILLHVSITFSGMGV